MSAMNHSQFSLAARGLHAVYRPNETNTCPGCGRTHWIIGRISAECAFCSTALPFIGETVVGAATIVFQRRHIEPARRGRFTINGRAA
jgi:hypothetical protein